MAKPPIQIVSVGESTVDHYLDLKRQWIGGISLNFAVHCKRTGAESVSLVSRIGEDHGTNILERLAQEEIDTSHVRILSGKTARQDIRISSDGERIFPVGGYDAGVLQNFLLNESEISFVQEHNVIACALFRQVEPLFHQLIELPLNGWLLADFLDLSDYDNDVRIIGRFHEKLTILFLSGDRDTAERVRPISRESKCLIVVTLGSAGSIALVKGEPIFQPSSIVKDVVDTTGCGDAFQAAFTVCYWKTRNVQLALESAANYSARVLSHYGAIG